MNLVERDVRTPRHFRAYAEAQAERFSLYVDRLADLSHQLAVFAHWLALGLMEIDARARRASEALADGD